MGEETRLIKVGCGSPKDVVGCLVVAPVLSVIMSACAQTQFLATGRTYDPWKGSIKIFREAPKGIRYEEIGWISGKMEGAFSDWGAILKKMQKEAADRGANAIILINKEASMQSIYGGSYEEKNLMAIAIRILENAEGTDKD